MGGWKPKKIPIAKPKYVNIFPLRYDEQQVDELIKEYVKNKGKYNEALIYLGTTFGMQDHAGTILTCYIKIGHTLILTS